MEFASLSLLAGSPFPLPGFGLALTQPSVKEISFMGEVSFYHSLAILNTSKDKYQEQMEKTYADKPEELEFLREKLMFLTDYSLTLELLESNPEMKMNFQSLLYLIVPNMSKCFMDDRTMILTIRDGEKPRQIIVNDELFKELRDGIEKMFQSDSINKNDFNPVNDKAAQIAEKIRKRRSIVAHETGKDGQKTSALATAVSIISTADGIPLHEVLEYTVPQLFFQLERSKKYNEYKTQITLGAFSGLKDVEISEWMETI